MDFVRAVQSWTTSETPEVWLGNWGRTRDFLYSSRHVDVSKFTIEMDVGIWLEPF